MRGYIKRTWRNLSSVRLSGYSQWRKVGRHYRITLFQVSVGVMPMVGYSNCMSVTLLGFTLSVEGKW